MNAPKALIVAALAAAILGSSSLAAVAGSVGGSAGVSSGASIAVGGGTAHSHNAQAGAHSTAQAGAQSSAQAGAQLQAGADARVGLRRAQEAVAAALARLEARGKADIHLYAVLDRLVGIEARQATEAEVLVECERAAARLTAEGRTEAAAGVRSDVDAYLKARADLRAAIEAALEQDPTNAGLYAQASAAYQAAGGGKIRVFVQGKQPPLDVEPVIVNGRALVPIRAVAESLKAKVDYDARARVVIITRGDATIRLPIDSTVAVVNGHEVHLDVAATIRNGRTIVPLRFVSEALSTQVSWDGAAKMIVILDHN